MDFSHVWPTVTFDQAWGRSGETVPFTLAVSVSPSPFALFPGSFTYGLSVLVLERPSCLPEMVAELPVSLRLEGYIWKVVSRASFQNKGVKLLLLPGDQWLTWSTSEGGFPSVDGVPSAEEDVSVFCSASRSG